MSVESFLQSTGFVTPGQKEVEERNHSTLKLRTTASIDGGRAESSPNDVLADVGSNEQGNARAQSVTLLE